MADFLPQKFYFLTWKKEETPQFKCVFQILDFPKTKSFFTSLKDSIHTFFFLSFFSSFRHVKLI